MLYILTKKSGSLCKRCRSLLSTTSRCRSNLVRNLYSRLSLFFPRPTGGKVEKVWDRGCPVHNREVQKKYFGQSSTWKWLLLSDVPDALRHVREVAYFQEKASGTSGSVRHESLSSWIFSKQDEVEQNIVICQWRADQLFGEAEVISAICLMHLLSCFKTINILN